MRKITAVITVSVLLLFMLAGCAEETAQVPELLEPVGVEMDTAIAYIGPIYNIETYEGLVLPKVEELSFISDGTISEVNVFTGSVVKKGDVLARLNVSAYETQLETLKSTIAFTEANNELTRIQAQCDIEIAKTELEELKDQNADDSKILLKQIQVESLQNQYDADVKLSDLSLEDSYKKIGELNKKIASSTVISPCDGRVVSVTAAEGGYAAAFTPLIWLANDNDTYISCKYISNEKVNNASEVYATVAGERVEVEYQPYTQAEYLSIVASGADPVSKFTVTDSKGFTVESGMYVAVFVISNYTENAVVVPAAAVKKDSGGDYYVVKLVDGEKVRQTVKKGVSTDAIVQITEGLKEGDEVVVGN